MVKDLGELVCGQEHGCEGDPNALVWLATNGRHGMREDGLLAIYKFR